MALSADGLRVVGRYMRRIASLVTALAAAACIPLLDIAVESAPQPAAPAAARGPRSVPIRDRFARARLQLLRVINAERAATGLAPVALDSLAAVAAQRHAEAMADGDFYSHYDLAGRAPYERLAALGGTAHVIENVLRWRQRDEDPLLEVDPWQLFAPGEAHAALMESPPHREAILDPHRTGVGIGFAVDSVGGAVYVVEDFVARHAAVVAPSVAPADRPARIAGRVLVPGILPLAIVLRREPARRPWPLGEPPPGPYDDGGADPLLVPPWAFAVLPDGSFAIDVGGNLAAGRYYGVLYVAPSREVELALARRRAYTSQGWPGAAFVLEVRAS